MKLLIVTAGSIFSTYGGGQVYVLSILEEFLKQGYLPCLATPSHKGDSVVDYQGGKVYCFSPNSEQAELERLLRIIKPDIVHIHGYKSVFARACCAAGVPCLVTAHHGGIVCPAGTLLNHRDEICRIPADQESCLPCVLKNIRWGILAWPVLRILPLGLRLKIGMWLKKLPFLLYITPIGMSSLSISSKKKDWDDVHTNAQCIIAPSHAIAESMARNGAPQNKIQIIPHGIPVNNAISNNTSNEDVFVPKQRPVRFFFIGRICHVKGVHVMLEAFHGVTDMAELHIIGGTGNKTEQRYLKILKDKYRSDTRIIWHGKVPHQDISGLIKNFDIMIHPAIYLEVFGLNIAESLAMGKPVLATRCGGAEMQIEDGVNGWLVEPNNAQAMKSQFKELLKDTTLQSQIDTRRVPVKRIEAHCKELIDVYKEWVKDDVTQN